MKARLTIVALTMLAAVVPARAQDLETTVRTRIDTACATASQDCATADGAVHLAFEAMKRTGGGISYADERNENENPPLVVEVGSFYFAPRVMQVDPGQVITFVNTSPDAGNRHIVNSSDWGAGAGNGAAFPVPGSLSFGGGSFSSGILQPGQSWQWPLELGAHPEAGVPLGIDKVLIPYHCNMHGSAQMNGYLILRTREY